MRPQIIMPWRNSGDPHRHRNAKFLKRYYETNGFEVYLSDSTYEKFNRSNSRNLGVANTSDYVITLIDADVYIPIDSLNEAIEQASKTPNLIKPFTHHKYLNEEETESFLKGEDITGARAIHETVFCGAAYIINRDSWGTVGGFDERFVDWGGEDNAFHMMCIKRVGVQFVSGYSFDLWHPAVRQISPVNNEIYLEYLRAY